MKKMVFSLTMLLSVSLIQACSQANSSNSPENSSDSSNKDLYSQIQELANVEGCTSSSDCALLPVGNKPCGGPESYMPYSKTNSDVAQLQKLGQQYSEMRKQYNKDNQVMGTCVMTPKPQVSCLRNQCVTTSKQGGYIQ